MTAPPKSPRHQPTNYLVVGGMTLVVYLIMLWVAHYMPEELNWARYLVHVLLLLALILIGVGIRREVEKRKLPPLTRSWPRPGEKRIPPGPRRKPK
jgi:hypothetical protein